ncbi:HAD-IB family phosphatase [Streptomyces sp. NRRL B-24572]|uniref:HAD-IB family phosphatase n=1 Tax=Streptomyces sp. NRRL B-24572 TaxID=1962156 RepID=UPI000A398730|nr:HAD-IB family phosphatase [Streptomyces sp. NRRL B-24572]
MTEQLLCPDVRLHAAVAGPPPARHENGRRFDAVIADIDDTLTLDNSAAELLAASGIPGRRLRELIGESESGRLDQAAADLRLLELLNSTGRLDRETAEAVFAKIRLRPSVLPMVRAWKRAGLRVGLVSASFNTHVDHIAARLDVSDRYSNVRLTFDPGGALTQVRFTCPARSG